MSLRKEIILSLCVLVGIILISIAYATNDDNFWKFVDSGWMVITIVFIISSQGKHVLTIALWLLFAGVFNSWVTSMFFDVTKFELHQKVIAWVTAGMLLMIGSVHTIWDYYFKKRIRREQLSCKKDARKKYRDMINRINNIENKLSDKSEALDNIVNNLLKNE